VQLFIAVIGLFVLLAGAGAPAAAAQPFSPGPPDFVSGRVLVGFHPGTPAQTAVEVVQRVGGEIIETLPGIEVLVVRVPAGQEMARIQAYQNNPNVEFAEVNGIWSVEWTPDDPMYHDQWQYHNTGQTGGTADADIDAPEAWAVTPGSDTVSIAVLDTGIDPNHPDIGPKVIASANFTDSTTTNDIHGHGTHVAGSVAALTNNGQGVSGTCPACVLLNVKVLGDSGGGSWDGIAKGIDWSANNGAKVINMSLGGGASRTVERAVNNAWNKGVVIVAAAGNNGNNQLHYPAAYNNVMAVAATDHNDQRASFSNWGSWVSVAAPGTSILSTILGGGYDYKQGTSMASPHVAGQAGLIWSKGDYTTNSGVRTQIEQTADKIAGTGTSWAHGRINACKAVGGACDVATSPPTVEIINPTHNSEVSGTVTIQVHATDEEDAPGTLKTEISINNGAWQPLTHITENLYQLDWDTNGLYGAYTMLAKAIDSDGNTAFSQKVVVLVLGPVSLPGMIQAENYRPGGQNVAYWDSSAGNTGNVYRDDDVDIEMCGDPTTPAGEACYNVGWVTNGEWLTYDISVTETATFAFTARVASVNSDTFLHIELDGSDISGPIAVPNTGGWQTWVDVTSPAIEIPGGSHVLKLVAKNAAGGYLFNLNYVTVEAVGDVVEPPPSTAEMRVSDLSGSTSTHGRNWRAIATATIVQDTTGNAVEGATVHGIWSNEPNTNVSCNTGSDGSCSIPSAILNNATASVSFTLTTVTHTSYADLSVNQSITILKP
jgi:thermitase